MWDANARIAHALIMTTAELQSWKFLSKYSDILQIPNLKSSNPIFTMMHKELDLNVSKNVLGKWLKGNMG